MLHRFAICVALAGSLAAAGCDDTVTTGPSAVVSVAVTDTFSGTLSRNGAATYPFSTNAGSVTATITVLSPDSTVVVGVSMGVWNGNSCEVILSRDNATQGTSVVGSATAPGNLCVRIHDIGTLVQPSAYQIDVTHP